MPVRPSDAAVQVWLRIASTSSGRSGRGRSWPMSWTSSRLAPGIARRVCSPPFGRISVSARPWMTSVGTSSSAQCGGAGAGGADRRGLAEHPLGEEQPVVRRCSALRPIPPGRTARAGHRPRPRATEAAIAPSRSDGIGCNSAARTSGTDSVERRLAGGRHDRGQRPHPVGMLDRHRLDDHPAERRADDVGPFDAEVVEHARRRRRPCRQPVRDLGHRPVAGPRRHHRRRGRRGRRRAWSTDRSRGCRSG